MSKNKLSDLIESGYSIEDAIRKYGFEEGSFTPTIYGTTTAGAPTYTRQTGAYEKIGRTVTGRIQIILSAKGGIAGDVRIGGLPFTAAAILNGGLGSAYVGYAKPLAVTAGDSLTGYVAESSDIIRLYVWDATTGTTTLLDTEITDTLNILISFTYIT